MTSTRSLGRPDPAAETCFVDEPRHGDRLADDSALFIRMNDLVIQNGVVIPVLWRNGVAVAATKLRGPGSERLGHVSVEAAILVQGLTGRDAPNGANLSGTTISQDPDRSPGED